MKTIISGVAVLLFLAGGVAGARDWDKLSGYMYEDTRELVALVEDAAAVIEQKGAAAFGEFGVKNSKWFNGRHYLFVYDLDGTCRFHPIEPALVGQDLLKFKDFDKRPVIALITAVGKSPEPDAGGWIFYLWEDSWKSPVPRWKSSYVRKAIAPDGAVYLVGSGLYNMKIERVFVQDRVDKAAALILAKGRDAAFAELRDRACPLHVLDTYITVADSRADVVVDPSFPMLAKKRNIANFHDMTGRFITREISDGLKDKDSLWLVYSWPKEGGNRLARHMLYVRKVTTGGETFFVSADFVPATPVWMK